MSKKSVLPLFFIVCILAIAGCSKNIIVNVDGMPVSNHEYQLTNQETKIRAVFVLARYYSEDEGDGERITKPEFLDTLHVNHVNADESEQLILHLKVVNLEKKEYAIRFNISGPTKNDQQSGQIYSGRLSRKDFFIKLPLDKPGLVAYDLHITGENGDDLYDLPQMRYKVKGGGGASAQYTGSN